MSRSGRIKNVLPNAATIIDGDSLPVTGGTLGAQLSAIDTQLAQMTQLTNVLVTVGSGGTYSTLAAAITAMAKYKPAYLSGGVRCEIRILAGTVIAEQIIAEQMDFSHIVITSEDAFVNVNATGWVETLDSRGSKPMFSGQHGTRLPVIGTLFKLQTGTLTMGYFCNRGSTGVILGSDSWVGKACGFDGFYDNILANNNSEIVVRYGVARNAGRWGIHARHISRISARSCDLTGCAIAAYADRCSMVDVRQATMTGSTVALNSYHASTITANGATANNLATSDYAIIATHGSIINASDMTITDPSSKLFKVENGGTITVFDTDVSGMTWGQEMFSQTKNTLAEDGVIFSDLTDISLTTFADIQTAVRAGTIGDVFSVGDQIAVTHSAYGTLTFRVIGIDEDTPTDVEKEHSLTLEMVGVLHDFQQFDAMEDEYALTADAVCVTGKSYYSFSDPTYTLLVEGVDWNAGDSSADKYEKNTDKRVSEGYCRWEDSGIRQWLNSDAAANAWWVAQNIWDNAPAYANVAGFLNGLDANFVAVLGTVTKTTLNDYVYGGTTSDTVDKVFLLSAAEVGKTARAGIVEGTVYSYYDGAVAADLIKNDIQAPFAAKNWYHRTPYYSAPTADGLCRIITSAGEDGTATAKTIGGISPAVVIW